MQNLLCGLRMNYPTTWKAKRGSIGRAACAERPISAIWGEGLRIFLRAKGLYIS